MHKISASSHRMHLVMAIAAVFACLATTSAPAAAAVVNVGTSAVSKIRYYSDSHSNGQAVVVEMTGTTACNGSTSYAVPLDDRNQHIYAGIVAAFLAGKQIEVAVETSSSAVPYTQGRCTINAMVVHP